jgi:hypothetical protein
MRFIGPAFATLLTFAATTSATAHTWRVERDGSGDFAVIQDAVDAAASGDTIRIGPGRYNEGQIVTCPGWSEFVRVLVTQAELTLLGSGPETIIGQENAWDLSQGDHKGVAAGSLWGAQAITIEGVHFENMGDGVYADVVAPTIKNCTFRNNYYSLTVFQGNLAVVENCQFEGQPRDGTHIFVWNSGRCEIRDSSFILADYSQWSTKHVSITGTDESVIERCEFQGGTSGTAVSYGGPSFISNCTFLRQSNIALWAGPGQTLTVEDCAFREVRAMTVTGWTDTHLIARRCVFEDVVDCTIQIHFAGIIDIQDCDLDRGLLGVVWMDDTCIKTPALIDLRNNYWGTDNADSIQAWIRDSNDSPNTCGTVLYEPFENQSTPTERVTWGTVKSLFR